MRIVTRASFERSETSESLLPQKSTSSWGTRAGLALSLLTVTMLTATVCAGCPASIGGLDGGPGGFDDHTVGRMLTTQEFSDRARVGPQSQTVKFVVTEFSSGAQTGIRYMESSAFYTLHDEWYWFRLMNGASVPGSDRAAVSMSFESIADIYTWAIAQPVLPLDLRFINERLYSPEFYSMALSQRPRVFGLGSLLHFPARNEPAPREEIWAFELEYSDDVSHAELDTFFQMILSTVPPALASEVKWLVRSPDQEELATRMETLDLPWKDRILRYKDITVTGEVEVYSEGFTAGRLRMVRSGESGLEDSRATDVLVVQDIPDYLPPTAALLTALPQTPLAHINVLARNRGIPNAFVAGIFEDPLIDSLGRVSAPVAVRAIAKKEGVPGAVDIISITESQFASWRALSSTPIVSVPIVNTSTAPLTLDLGQLRLQDVETLRPLIGGKAAGFLALQATTTRMLEIPHKPLVITARLFREHLTQYRATVDALLDERDFQRSARMRYLALEGEENFRERFFEAADTSFLVETLARPQGDIIGDVVRAGGLVSICENEPLPVSSFASILEELHAQFAAYARTQGLRFRSSSTVEDIEGFNGAGLYTSNSGFLYAAEMEREKDKVRTPTHAILKTFSSYWGSEAFEERELARVVHLSGSMAILVHARFDNKKEMSNGVFTFTIQPPEVEARTGDKYFLDVNVQIGKLSVTNPPPGVNARPEVFHVVGAVGAAPRVVRVSSSSEMPEGSDIFSDAMAIRLFEDAKAVTEVALIQENEGKLTSKRSRTLTLDFELREMDREWPLLLGTNQFARRVVIKQARSLEPSTIRLPENVKNYPLPRDIAARARRVERRECTGANAKVLVVEVYTDPLSPPDLGYNATPFTGFITVSTDEGVPALGWPANYRRTFVHGTMATTHPGLEASGDWALAVEINDNIGNITGFRSALLTENAITLVTDDGALESVAANCILELPYSTADEYLATLFEQQ